MIGSHSVVKTGQIGLAGGGVVASNFRHVIPRQEPVGTLSRHSCRSGGGGPGGVDRRQYLDTNDVEEHRQYSVRLTTPVSRSGRKPMNA